MSESVLKLTGRASKVTQDAYRRAVAKMKRLSRPEDADTKAEARQAIREKALTEDAERRPPGQRPADEPPGRPVTPGHAAEERIDMDRAAREVAAAQLGPATHETAKRTAAEAARPEAEEIHAARKQRHAMPLPGRPRRVRKSKAERAGSHLDREGSGWQELEQTRNNDQKLLTQALARIRELEQVRQNDQSLLTQKRTRIQELEQQLSVRQNGQNVLEPKAHVEAGPLMERAHLLLDQGKIVAARSVLERIAESGSAWALFLLAETYNPASLSAWGMLSKCGIFGRRGDVAKARDLYTKASTRGVQEAIRRLRSLR